MGNCTVSLPGSKPAKKHVGVGAAVEVIADIALSSSYATGGDTLPLAALGVDSIQAVLLGGGALSPAGHAVEVIYGATDRVAPLLRIRDVATGAEIANATNLSAQSIRAVVKANYAYV